MIAPAIMMPTTASDAVWKPRMQKCWDSLAAMRAILPGSTMAMMIDEIVAPVIAVNTCRPIRRFRKGCPANYHCGR